MINRTLHSITNRAGGFNTTSLQVQTTFLPTSESVESRRLRQLLGVDQAQDDYHVFAILGAVEAFPEVQDAFADPSRSYTLQDYQRPAPRINGAALLSGVGGSNACALASPSTPVPAGFLLEYMDTGFARLTYGQRQDVLPVDVLDGNKVYPRWPSDFGFVGGFQITWDSTARVEVLVRPRNFPYDILAENLRRDDCKNEFLRRHSLLTDYQLAANAMKQVAVVALALGLSNPAVYG